MLYLNFQENPIQLGRLIHSLDGGLDGPDGPLWNAIYASPVELQIDSLIGRTFSLIGEAGIRRVVVDGVGDLLLAAGDPQRVHDYLYALTQHFARNSVSSMLTFETGIGIRGSSGSITDQLRFSALTDCIILLDLERKDRLRRTACVLKAA